MCVKRRRPTKPAIGRSGSEGPASPPTASLAAPSQKARHYPEPTERSRSGEGLDACPVLPRIVDPSIVRHYKARRKVQSSRSWRKYALVCATPPWDQSTAAVYRSPSACPTGTGYSRSSAGSPSAPLAAFNLRRPMSGCTARDGRDRPCRRRVQASLRRCPHCRQIQRQCAQATNRLFRRWYPEKPAPLASNLVHQARRCAPRPAQKKEDAVAPSPFAGCMCGVLDPPAFCEAHVFHAADDDMIQNSDVDRRQRLA